MTEDSGVERAGREHARATGRRYARARAEFDGTIRPFARTRPVDLDRLRAHLESTYGVAVTSLRPVDDDPATRPRGSWPGHYPSTLVARLADGERWVVRVSSSAADRLERAEGDVQVLEVLAAHGFPAERPAREHAVSEVDGAAVVVTAFLPGGRPTDDAGRVVSPTVFHELGDLLGRLHALPPIPGAASRDGGAEEHDGGFGVGRPKEDLAAAMRFLVDVEDRVEPAGRATFELLRTAVESADDAEGLPEALTHGNFHAWAAVGVPGDLHVVGWAGSGRGPRLPALAWLLRTASEGGPDDVDAVVRGYREHVRLTGAELDRLPGVLDIRPLWLACLDHREAVRRGQGPGDVERAGGTDGASGTEAPDGYGFYRPEITARLVATVAELASRG